VKITAELFAAFLKCPHKCWLLSRGERAEGNAFAQWARERGAAAVAAMRKGGREGKLLLAFGEIEEIEEIERSAGVAGDTALTGDTALRNASTTAGVNCSKRCRRSALSREALPPHSKVARSKAARLLDDVRKRLAEIEALIAGGAKAPELVLNRHCAECEFRDRCRQQALEQDNLSLLAGMGARERERLRAKGIFTVTQLSHTFQPRRKPKWLQNRAEKYHHALKALAIREQKIHLVGKPALKIEGTPVYLDVEGMADGVKGDRYYLIGARIGEGADATGAASDASGASASVARATPATQHSFWADSDTDADEAKIWREFLAVLNTVERPVLVHYGRYETIFLKRMQSRHGGPEPGSAAAGALESAVNLVSVIYARIYFPTYSNGLKEIAQFLGYAWASPAASGTQAVVWRDIWTRAADAEGADAEGADAEGAEGMKETQGTQGTQATQGTQGTRAEARQARQARRERARRELLAYNADDCAALALVTRRILELQNPSGAVVDTATLRRANPYGFKRNQFFYPEMGAINQAAYWDYQREKVYVKSDPRLRRALQTKKKKKKRKKPPIDRHVECEVAGADACPRCGSPAAHAARPNRKYDRVDRIIHDLKFTRKGLRRQVTHYHCHRRKCGACGHVYRPRTPGLPRGKFGASLMAYAVWQNIELRMSHEMIDRGLNELFDLRLARGSAQSFKSKAAQTHAGAHDALLRRLRGGALLHVDETKVSVAGFQGCVWVFASLDTVAYVYAPSRESEWLKTFLADFRGVLVTDFYSGYDALPCAKQRCLIHFLRDLNDDLFKHPYDEDFKRLGRDFADLVKPIIATVGQRGLKTRHLKKHQAGVARFFRKLAAAKSGSAIFKKYQERFSRERAELFTFLRHDGVPWNNNNAEHAVKAFAMLRQVINGVTTENGLREYLVLLSLCETCKTLGVKFLDFLRSGQADAHEFAGSGAGRMPVSSTGILPV